MKLPEHSCRVWTRLGLGLGMPMASVLHLISEWYLDPNCCRRRDRAFGGSAAWLSKRGWNRPHGFSSDTATVTVSIGPRCVPIPQKILLVVYSPICLGSAIRVAVLRCEGDHL